MVEALFVCLAYASSYAGFALLALRQRPHHAAVAGLQRRSTPPPASRRRKLVLGAALLAASFAASLLAQGPSFGSLLWVLLLAAGAQSVLFTLTYRPHWLRPVQRATAPASGAT